MDVKSRIAARFVRGEKLPNELLIQLRASAIRMSWSPSEERRRRGCISHGVAPLDASPDFCRIVADRCGRSRASRQSRMR